MEPIAIDNKNVSINILALTEIGKSLNYLKVYTNMLIDSIENAAVHYKKINEQIENKL